MADISSNTTTPNENDCRFQGQTIVITGAGGNFGRAGCLYFCQRGARVAAMDVNAEALQQTVTFVQDTIQATAKTPPTIAAFVCNVTDAASVATAMQAVVDKFGRIDLLWNNAGYQGEIKPTLEYDPVDFDRVMRINVTGMFIVLQAAARQMTQQHQKEQQENNSGVSHPYSIVNTASVAGLRGTPAMVAYASSKAAVLSMTVSTSKDLAPHGIRVNAVSPALIGPDDGYMWRRQNELHASSGSPYFARDPAVVAQAKVNSVPLKRLGTVEEVVQSVAFLLSREASYTTGTNLVIDGGMSSGLRC